MFIRAITTTIEEHEVDVSNLAEFRARFPCAKIQTIDGKQADSQCEKGHIYHSEGPVYEHGSSCDPNCIRTRCKQCYESIRCKHCERSIVRCVCHRCDDYDD